MSVQGRTGLSQTEIHPNHEKGRQPKQLEFVRKGVPQSAAGAGGHLESMGWMPLGIGDCARGFGYRFRTGFARYGHSRFCNLDR